MNEQIDCGDAAFPTPNGQFFGMSLRDYFAANAPKEVPPEFFDDYCRNIGFRGQAPMQAAWAFAYADAMLLARAA